MAPANLWTVFADTAARLGERAAVEILRSDGVERFTYRQLHDMASARASWLRSLGIARGDRCAILAHNDAHWCAAYLAILKLGAVAVPLDTNYSPAQVATIVRDAGARVMFVSEKLRPHALDSGIELLDLHREPGPLEPLGPVEPVEPSATAVILYTSGTTSDPKGVVLSHGNLLAERDAAFAVVTVTDRDAILGVLPLFHALAQLANLLLPFAVGAKVVFLETINSTELLRALKDQKITIFACVPQFFYLIHQRVTQQVEKAGLAAKLVFRLLLALNFRLRRVGINLGARFFGRVHDVMGRELRLMVTGGSKFDPAVGRDLYALGFTILQAYGLTETSAAATINTPDEAHLDTVGRPLPGVKIKIVPDEAGGGDGEGEIAICGPIVMQGYHNRPEATAAVMADGWFLTGDLGRMDADGRITITGRKKEIIVLASGKNIYPEEIEAHYRKSAFVREICVMGLAEPGRPTSERLHALVVPNMDLMRERKIVNAGDILRFELEGLSVGLPPHKRVLGYDISFDLLPRTTTQKIKRHEVETRVRERHRRAAEVREVPLAEADRAWLEDPHASAAVKVIEGRLRGGVRVRADANLELDLGLDSMERVELLTELEQAFEVHVPGEAAAEIFTVRQLVDALREAEGKPRGPSPPAKEESWAVILRDLPPASDPMLGPLLRARPLAAPLHFVLLRIVRLLFFRVKVSGLDRLPRSGPYIISPNHQSYVDPFVLCGVLPYRVFKDLFYVGAIEYFETPLTRWVARSANIVPVDADSNLVPAMKAGAFGLAHGKILMLFPEGERSIDGTVKKFKKGSPILAQHLGVPIVPVALKGVYELWPRNRDINWRLVAPWSGHRARVEIGAPMTVAEGGSYNDNAAALRERVDAMWSRL